MLSIALLARGSRLRDLQMFIAGKSLNQSTHPVTVDLLFRLKVERPSDR
jgi:hypothetical protein